MAACFINVHEYRLDNGQVLVIETTRSELGAVLATRKYIKNGATEKLSDEMVQHLIHFHVKSRVASYTKGVTE